MYDAAVALEGGYRPYAPTPAAPANTSPEAAIATAAYDTLTGLQPQLGADQTILDDDYTAYMAAIPDGTAVENAAKQLGYSHRRITSGAGHDACNLNTVMPAAMVFVPCKDGISHNELEDATQADCAAGANVLMHTVLALAGVAS